MTKEELRARVKARDESIRRDHAEGRTKTSLAIQHELSTCRIKQIIRGYVNPNRPVVVVVTPNAR